MSIHERLLNKTERSHYKSVKLFIFPTDVGSNGESDWCSWATKTVDLLDALINELFCGRVSDNISSMIFYNEVREPL